MVSDQTYTKHVAAAIRRTIMGRNKSRAPGHLTWGFALFGLGQEFRVVTAGGEGLAWTVALLDEIRGAPVWIWGRVPALIDAMVTIEDLEPGMPVREIRVTAMITGFGNSADYSHLETTLVPATCIHPYVFCAPSRPPGWPP